MFILLFFQYHHNARSTSFWMIVHGTSIMVEVTTVTQGVIQLKSLGLQTSGIDFRRLLELKCLIAHHLWIFTNVEQIILDGSRGAIPQKLAKLCPGLFVSVIVDRNVFHLQIFQDLSKLQIVVVIMSTSYPTQDLILIADIVQQTKTKWKHQIFFFICWIPWFYFTNLQSPIKKKMPKKCPPFISENLNLI